MTKNLLIIGFVWPEPKSTAAGRRMLQLIDFFQKNDYLINFVSTASKTTKSFNLEELGIQTKFSGSIHLDVGKRLQSYSKR